MNKVILVNGFAGIGKTTISNMYAENHPPVASIEGDVLIAKINNWRENEDQARAVVFEETKSILEEYLKDNRDVLLPYLLTNHTHAEEFQKITEAHGATFYEILLDTNKKEAIERLFERGVWGEEGSPKLTEEDRGEIEKLFDKMTVEVAKRPNTIKIEVKKDQIRETYSKFMEVVSD